MSVDQKINSLKKQIEDIKAERIRIATKLKALEDEKQLLLKECQTLGVDPKKLAETITELEATLNTSLTTLQDQIDTYYALKA